MSKNFKEGLIEAIKVAGQMIIDNAEDIAGKTDNMSYLDISVNFDPENGSIPELAIYRSHYPPREKLEHILDTFSGKKDAIDNPIVVCNDCGKNRANHPDLKFYKTSEGYLCDDCHKKSNLSVAPLEDE